MIFCSSLWAEVPKLISYQGVLKDSTGEAVEDDVYALKFRIYDDSIAESILWESEGFVPLQTKDGLFQHILGSTNPIPDSISRYDNLWLGITVEIDPELTPRTQLVSVPFSLRSQYADTANVVLDGGNSNWTVTDSVLYTNSYWGLARGDAGNVLYGDSSHTMVNLGVACMTGTDALNERYVTVSGGRSNAAMNDYSTVSGGCDNIASGDWSLVGGGVTNTASGRGATISGGWRNIADSNFTAIGGGKSNKTHGVYSVVCGGGGGDSAVDSNSALGDYSAIGGGARNIASGERGTIGGGWGNTASGTAVIVGGGYQNLVDGNYSAVLGGYADTITASADYSYLFGISSKLTEDSTLMVDMPHIHFGDEATGYEFPTTDGASGQVMATDGNGQLNWVNISAMVQMEMKGLLITVNQLKQQNEELSAEIAELKKKFH